MMYNLSTSKDKEATSERLEFSGPTPGSAFSTADPHPELGENLPFSSCRLCLHAESTHPKHPKKWSPWKQNVDTHKWKASHFFVQATRNTRSWRNLLTADCRHKYILVSPCYKTSIKAFMAATTQSCSDIERTPSSDREVPRPRRNFWTLNTISKSGQNGPELGGLRKHPYVLNTCPWQGKPGSGCVWCVPSRRPRRTRLLGSRNVTIPPPHAIFRGKNTWQNMHYFAPRTIHHLPVWKWMSINTVASIGMSLTKLIDKPKSSKTKQVDTGWQSDSSITQHSAEPMAKPLGPERPRTHNAGRLAFVRLEKHRIVWWMESCVEVMISQHINKIY